MERTGRWVLRPQLPSGSLLCTAALPWLTSVLAGGEGSLCVQGQSYALLHSSDPPYIFINSLFIKIPSNSSVCLCPLFLIGTSADIVILLGIPFFVLMNKPCALLLRPGSDSSPVMTTDCQSRLRP